MLTDIIAWCLILIPMMYSPGPTNILVAATGASYGMRGTIPLMVGINVGIFFQLLIVAVGVGHFFHENPGLMRVMHYFGVLYMFYLAWQFWRAPTTLTTTTVQIEKKSTFMDGVLVELLNPKVWFSLVAIFSTFAKGDEPLGSAALIFPTVTVGLNVVNNLLWAALGAFLIRSLCSGRFAKLQNVLYATTMAGVGIWMLWDGA